MIEEPSSPSARLIALSKPVYTGCLSSLCIRPKQSESFLGEFGKVLEHATHDDVNDLLIEPNWRTRIVGAYFAAFKGWSEFEETIGRLLVKDQLVYASVGYAFALSAFATVQASNYLCSYLYNNYAGRCTDCSSVGYAVGGVKYLDERLGTSCLDQNLDIWHQKITERPHGFYPNNKPYDDVEKAREYLRKTLTTETIEESKSWASQMVECVKSFERLNKNPD